MKARAATTTTAKTGQTTNTWTSITYEWCDHAHVLYTITRSYEYVYVENNRTILLWTLYCWAYRRSRVHFMLSLSITRTHTHISSHSISFASIILKFKYTLHCVVIHLACGPHRQSVCVCVREYVTGGCMCVCVLCCMCYCVWVINKMILR